MNKSHDDHVDILSLDNELVLLHILARSVEMQTWDFIRRRKNFSEKIGCSMMRASFIFIGDGQEKKNIRRYHRMERIGPKAKAKGFGRDLARREEEGEDTYGIPTSAGSIHIGNEHP
ncbi:hypothetical protein NST44_08865 [Paenibacillus sp. FSL W8-0919]|uniref:hypothetical protein n=1 Tax=Paenibacillus sp. FSL W8-0919 TaxID=2954707 RepID=UPI0030F85FA3